ncbi:MAG: KEOPS complex kinase/ATPase Bud32 [Methanomethylophilus sp.]|nr:KEOPS complex kinase/ATPase Bud32 [Methanomethylophilus sp.]
MKYAAGHRSGMDMEGLDEIAVGAEGSVYRTEFLGRRAILKVRSTKGYRAPELDSRIRSLRIRSEARLIRDARRAGIRTPMIYWVDPAAGEMIMEDMGGETVKKHLDEHPEDADAICREIGRDVALLHNARIAHGDLTTSNMLISGGKICFIDFSMGVSLAETEDMGVDIRLLERAFSSAHPNLTHAYGELIDSYCRVKTQPSLVMDKVREIKERGRYT